MSEEYQGVVEIIDSGVLATISKAEIDQQIATAKKYPRDLGKFQKKTESIATLSPEIAGECFYRLERKDKDGKVKVIEGPSARMAEIVVQTWGNCRAGTRLIEEGERFVTAQGVFHDLESNSAIATETRRRITNKNGGRYQDDMIGVTANAACSIALRNAIFKGVPRALWEGAYKQAVRCYKGDAKALPERRAVMLEYFAKMGVKTPRILEALGRQSVEAIDLDDIVRLRGMATAIKDGDTTIEETFPEAAPVTTVPKSKTDELAEKLAKEQAAASPGPGPAPATETKTEAAPPAEQSAPADTVPPESSAAVVEDENPVYLEDVKTALGNAAGLKDVDTLEQMVKRSAENETTKASALKLCDARRENIRGKRGPRSNE